MAHNGSVWWPVSVVIRSPPASAGGFYELGVWPIGTMAQGAGAAPGGWPAACRAAARLACAAMVSGWSGPTDRV